MASAKKSTSKTIANKKKAPATRRKTTKKKTPAIKKTMKSTEPVPNESRLRTKTSEAPRIIRAIRPVPTPEEIAERAYHFWERRGRIDGYDREDWLIAEADLTNGL
jgi:hypothetical protein